MWWTLVSTLVASFTAFIIAFYAYPWQKRKDRELQVMLERRASYASFLEASDVFFQATFNDPSEKSLREHADDLSLKFFNIMVHGSPEQYKRALAVRHVKKELFAAIISSHTPHIEDEQEMIGQIREEYFTKLSEFGFGARSEVIGIAYEQSTREITEAAESLSKE